MFGAFGSTGCNSPKPGAAEIGSREDGLSFSPEQFGAVGDGLANDREAFVSAVLAAASAKHVVSCRAGAIYNLGDLTDRIPLIRLMQANIDIHGNGAEVRVNTLVKGVTTLFDFTQPERIYIENLRVRDAGYDRFNLPVPTGVCVFRIGATSIADGGNVTIRDCLLEGGVALLICEGEPESKRIRTIRFAGTNIVRNAYYGICCQAQGDDLVGSLTVSDVRRAYIGYGNDGVAMHFNIHRSRQMANGSNGCISIASTTSRGTFRTDTRNIHITADCRGYLNGYNSLVLLQLQSDTQSARISNCNIRLILPDTRIPPVNSVAFRSYTLAGVEVVDGNAAVGAYHLITLSGNLDGAPISFPATQAARGRLSISGGLADLDVASQSRLRANFTIS